MPLVCLVLSMSIVLYLLPCLAQLASLLFSLLGLWSGGLCPKQSTTLFFPGTLSVAWLFSLLKAYTSILTLLCKRGCPPNNPVTGFYQIGPFSKIFAHPPSPLPIFPFLSLAPGLYLTLLFLFVVF